MCWGSGSAGELGDGRRRPDRRRRVQRDAAGDSELRAGEVGASADGGAPSDGGDGRDIKWSDGFEPYTVGQFPSPGWTYTGNSAIAVDTEKKAEGNQSLRAHASPGGCWEALPVHLLEVSTAGSFSIEFEMLISSDHVQGCHQMLGNAWLGTTADWTTNQLTPIIITQYDGSVLGRGGQIGTFAKDTWIKVRMDYQRTTATSVRSRYWIDDLAVATQDASTQPFESSLKYLLFGSGDGTIWIDNVTVW